MLPPLCFVENMEDGDESKWEETDLFKTGSEQVYSQVSILGEEHRDTKDFYGTQKVSSESEQDSCRLGYGELAAFLLSFVVCVCGVCVEADCIA